MSLISIITAFRLWPRCLILPAVPAILLLQGGIPTGPPRSRPLAFPPRPLPPSREEVGTSENSSVSLYLTLDGALGASSFFRHSRRIALNIANRSPDDMLAVAQ